MNRIIIFFLLTLLLQDAVAQPPEKPAKEISRLKATGIDTLIQLVKEGTGLGDTLPGLGWVHTIFEVNYLVYKNKNAVFARKFVRHCGKDCSGTYESVSGTVRIKDDSLFRYLGTSLGQLSAETVYPLIYRYTDSLSGQVVYNTVKTYHPTIYYVGIHLAQQDIMKMIVTENLERYVSGEDTVTENINYAYNRQTKLVQFFEFLKRKMEAYDRQFRFSK